jgi:hypothetical protein
MLYILWILSAFLGCGLACNQKDKKQPPVASQKVARVYNNYLLQQDIVDWIPVHIAKEDSLALIDSQLQSWITKHLLARKAEEMLHKEEAIVATIERKVADFRAALFMQHYLDNTVNASLDKLVTPQEIEQYYQQHQASFKLDRSIVKGKFVVIPKHVLPHPSIKQWLMSEAEQDLLSLEAYCKEFAQDYSLDENLWLAWDRIITKTPFMNIPDKARLLKKKSFTEVQDAQYRYYLKIDTYKAVGEQSPLALVSERIEKIIIYKRKLSLTHQLKEDVLKQAKVNHDYVIYNKE